jgi:prepilin-type processing-associated H-X9-DG protein
MPALERARKAAKQSKCAGNVHNIGLGIQMFRSDHDQRWIAGNPGYYKYGTCELQAFVMKDYLKDWKVYLCPSSDTSIPREPSLETTALTGMHSVADSCYEPPDSGNAQGWAATWALSYFYDEKMVDANPDPARVIDADTEAMCTAQGPQQANHADGANVLFVDNSVTWVTRDYPNCRWTLSNAQVSYGLRSNCGPGPTCASDEWVSYGFVQNPRLDEDGVDANTAQDGLQKDIDDIYWVEGTPHQWGTTSHADDGNDHHGELISGTESPTVSQNDLSYLAFNARDGKDAGWGNPSATDCALGGGSICPDWGIGWGQAPPFMYWRGLYPDTVQGLTYGTQYAGWQWGVPPEFENLVYQ